MKANVTRLKPRQGSLEDALEAYASGEFLLSEEICSRSTLPAAVILRARALIRLGKFVEAVNVARSIDPNDIVLEAAAELLVVELTALVMARRFDEVGVLSVEVRARCYSAGIPAIEGELLYAEVVQSLLRGDEHRASQFCDQILELSDDIAAWSRSRSYRFPLSYWRSRACEMHSGIEYSQGSRSGQASWLLRAFEEFDKSQVRDDYIASSILANYADAAVGQDSSITDFVVNRAERIIWTAALKNHEFRVFSSLAEALSLAGDQLGALRHFRRCISCAPSAALQVRASVERARLLSEMGESFSSREELDFAIRMSKAVDWEHALPTDQRQLLFLAAQAASYNGAEARRLLERYDGIDTRNSSIFLFKNDVFRGEEFFARAAVARGNANNDRAILLLLDALDVWTSAGHDAKAALAAAELADLTNEPHYVAIAMKQVAKQPKSILAHKMERYMSTRSIRSLQPVI